MAPQDVPHSILLVDDDADSLRLYRDALEWFGWTVETADNGPDAVIAALDNQPDAILLDLTMPGMDGGAVLDLLRRDPRTGAIPVIALASPAEWLQLDASRTPTEFRFDSVLLRPVQNDMLIRRILEVMTRPAQGAKRRERKARR